MERQAIPNLVLDLEFEGGLTEFTDGTVTLSKKQ